MQKMGNALKDMSTERAEIKEIKKEVNDLIDTDINELRAKKSIIY